jgi:hypothetical protein
MSHPAFKWEYCVASIQSSGRERVGFADWLTSVRAKDLGTLLNVDSQ